MGTRKTPLPGDLATGLEQVEDQIESLYARWQAAPDSVPADWRSFFAAAGAPASSAVPAVPAAAAHVHGVDEPVCRRLRLFELVEAYRTFGHRGAWLDPLSDAPAPRPELDPAQYSLAPADLDSVFDTEGLFGLQRATLRDVIERLKRSWCGTVGVEFMHVDEPEVRRWIAERMEDDGDPLPPPAAERRRVLNRSCAPRLSSSSCRRAFSA